MAACTLHIKHLGYVYIVFKRLDFFNKKSPIIVMDLVANGPRYNCLAQHLYKII
jgi:hypothetical protein